MDQYIERCDHDIMVIKSWLLVPCLYLKPCIICYNMFMYFVKTCKHACVQVIIILYTSKHVHHRVKLIITITIMIFMQFTSMLLQ